MPELPEVEVTRRSIAPHVTGARLLQVRLGKPLRWPLGCEPASLSGLALGEPSRRGKYLWLPLTQAAMPAGGLLLHLGMSGALSWWAAAPEPAAHDHADLITDRGTLRLTDPRRFGALVYSASLAEPPARTLLQRLGPEPFDEALTAATFHAALRQRRSAIKQVLLGGEVIVGAGNIYACEALFAAGIDPRCRSDRISGPKAQALLAALRLTLGRALELGGSTLRNFHDAQGEAGAFTTEARVYGREGMPCLRCGGTVRRIVQAQRSTFLCAGCQRRA